MANRIIHGARREGSAKSDETGTTWCGREIDERNITTGTPGDVADALAGYGTRAGDTRRGCRQCIAAAETFARKGYR